MKKILCLALFLSFSLVADCSAKSFSTKNFKNLYLNFGTWQEYYMQAQASQNGELNSFEFTPYFSFGMDYELTSKHLLLSEVGYVIRQNLDAVTKDHFFWRFDYAYQALQWLRLRAGTSFMWVTYNGDGSEKSFPNGNSTEVYYAPNERKNTFNQTLDFGVELMKDQFSLRLGSYIYAANEQDERLTSFSASVNYIMDLKDIWKR